MQRFLNTFERVAQESTVNVERQLVEDEAAGGLSLLARYSDLVVVGQANRDDPYAGLLQDLPEYVALGSGRPVLVVPFSGSYDNAGSRILLAWDGSLSATHTVASVLPMLKWAKNVDIVVLNPKSKPDLHGQQPGADIALYLARHGVHAEVVVEDTRADIGSALMDLAAKRNANMLVMGCYGHTRFREILLGGATRSILKKTVIPVLMAH